MTERERHVYQLLGAFVHPIAFNILIKRGMMKEGKMWSPSEWTEILVEIREAFEMEGFDEYD